MGRLPHAYLVFYFTQKEVRYVNESIINDNTTHDPEDYEAIHDHLADEDDIYNESYIISKKNYEINMDKWKPGTPLWITGSSGDGKSTYANQLAKEKKAFLVPLDLFLVRIAKPKEKYDKFLNDTSGTVISNGSQMVLDYINKHPELPWADPNSKGNWGTSGQDPELWNGLFDWLIDASAKNPKYKTKLIIFEGCNICLMPVEKAVKFPFIIMGTSRLQSSIRRIKRDKKEHDDYSIFKLVYRELKRSTKGVLPSLNKMKDNFEKGLKKQMKTINESHECLIMDNEEFFGETYKPFDEYLKLNHYDPKTGTIDASNEYHYGQRKSKIDKRRPISMPRSKKQWNRINKFLRENDYDPKTETIRTDVVDPKTGKKRRIKFNITDNFFNMKNRKTHAYFRYNDELENPERDGERDLSINMQPRTMGVKPRYSNFSLKHEEGHYDDYLAQLFNTEHLNEIRAIKQMALDFDAEEDAAGNYDMLTNKDTHDRQAREHYADWYGAKHNPYDKSPDGVHLADGFNQTHDEWKRKVVSEKGGNKKNIGELIETLAKSGPANFENNVKDLNLSDKDKAKLRAAVVNYARTKAEDRNLNSQKQLDKEKIYQQDDYKQMKSELRDIEKKLTESMKNKNSEDSEYFKNKYLELEKTFKDTFKPAEQSVEDEYSEKRKQLREKLEKDIKDFSEELNNKTRKRLENASNKEKHKNAVAMANKRYAPHDQGLEGREKFVNYANEKLKENPNVKINKPVDDWLKFNVKTESSNVLVSNEEFFTEAKSTFKRDIHKSNKSNSRIQNVVDRNAIKAIIRNKIEVKQHKYGRVVELHINLNDRFGNININDIDWSKGLKITSHPKHIHASEENWYNETLNEIKQSYDKYVRLMNQNKQNPSKDIQSQIKELQEDMLDNAEDLAEESSFPFELKNGKNVDVDDKKRQAFFYIHDLLEKINEANQTKNMKQLDAARSELGALMNIKDPNSHPFEYKLTNTICEVTFLEREYKIYPRKNTTRFIHFSKKPNLTSLNPGNEYLPAIYGDDPHETTGPQTRWLYKGMVVHFWAVENNTMSYGLLGHAEELYGDYAYEYIPSPSDKFYMDDTEGRKDQNSRSVILKTDKPLPVKQINPDELTPKEQTVHESCLIMDNEEFFGLMK